MDVIVITKAIKFVNLKQHTTVLFETRLSSKQRTSHLFANKLRCLFYNCLYALTKAAKKRTLRALTIVSINSHNMNILNIIIKWQNLFGSQSLKTVLQTVNLVSSLTWRNMLLTNHELVQLVMQIKIIELGKYQLISI